MAGLRDGVAGAYRKIIDYARMRGLDREEFRYLFAGGLTTLVNFSLFTLMHEIIGIDYMVSNVASISVSVVFAYVVNKRFVFRRRSNTMMELALEFIKFVGSRLFTMALEIGTVWLFFEVLALNATLGKAVSQVLVIILNYLISKLIVFRRTPS